MIGNLGDAVSHPLPWAILDEDRLVYDANREPVLLAPTAEAAQWVVAAVNYRDIDATLEVARLTRLVEHYRHRGEMTVSDREGLLGESTEQAVEPERSERQRAHAWLVDLLTDGGAVYWVIETALELGIETEAALTLMHRLTVALQQHGRLLAASTARLDDAGPPPGCWVAVDPTQLAEGERVRALVAAEGHFKPARDTDAPDRPGHVEHRSHLEDRTTYTSLDREDVVLVQRWVPARRPPGKPGNR